MSHNVVYLDLLRGHEQPIGGVDPKLVRVNGKDKLLSRRRVEELEVEPRAVRGWADRAACW